uniref:Uncharacterized protein n=1 Tax=Tetraselmis sp. GSL018 TaxID=582737 RepID=A0A061R5J5_9CHLO
MKNTVTKQDYVIWISLLDNEATRHFEIFRTKVQRTRNTPIDFAAERFMISFSIQRYKT